jgi:hypothetical protein
MKAFEEILAAIRRLPMPERLRLIQRARLEAAQDAPRERRALGVDEFLAARLTPPPGVGSLSLDDMERAIAEGACGRDGV